MMIRHRRTMVGALAFIAAWGAMALPARANLLDYFMDLFFNGTPLPDTPVDPATKNYSASVNQTIGTMQLTGTMSGNADPFVEYAFRITNTSAGPAPGFVNLGLGANIVPLLGPGQTMRATLQYSVEDTNANEVAAILLPPGTPLQEAFLSDNRTNFIFASGTALGAPGPITHTSPPFMGDTGALPLPAVPGNFVGGAFGVMGLSANFQLTPGDTAVVTGRFEIVPEPASFGLFMLSAVSLLRRRQ